MLAGCRVLVLGTGAGAGVACICEGVYVRIFFGSYFKYSKRCMCALSSLGAVGCRVRVGAWVLVPLLCATVLCALELGCCVWELGCWCCVRVGAWVLVPLLCARGSLGTGAAAVWCCRVRVGAWVLVPLLCATVVCTWELGRWCRCCVVLLCARGSLGACAAAVCAWELRCWCRCCVRLLCARGSLGAGAAAVWRCCVRVGASVLVIIKLFWNPAAINCLTDRCSSDEALRNPPEPDLLQPLLNPHGQSCASSPDHL